MPDEPITNPPTESPAPVDIPPPAPVVPVVAPAETSTPPVITPETIATSTPPVVPSTPPAPSSTPTSVGATEGKPENPIRSLLSKALAKIQFRKKAKLEKIMVLARQRGQVTNDQAQKLLRVSDATATRYLAELVKTGRLRRVGHPKHASYQPIP